MGEIESDGAASVKENVLIHTVALEAVCKTRIISDLLLYAEGVGQFQPRVQPWGKSGACSNPVRVDQVFCSWFRLVHPFRVTKYSLVVSPRCYLGLKLANAFGVQGNVFTQSHKGVDVNNPIVDARKAGAT